jgi:RNA polymerase sigma factor (sigma-70 family)
MGGHKQMSGAPWSLMLQQLCQSVRRTTLANQSDADLLARFVQRHDEAAFATLVRRHGSVVLGVCRALLRDSHDAEDAFQAVFFVLARKAGSIRKQESLACWLYGVAQRVARRARDHRDRRRLLERQVQAMLELPPQGAVNHQDLQEVLHEELGRLPEKFRAPLVLCYLQGKTHAQAATELGLHRVTVSERVSTGREQLRQRLAGRGVTLGGSALVGTLAESVVAAAAPAALVLKTTRGATLFVASGAAEALSGHAALLAEGTLQAMFIGKLKAAAVVIVAALVGVGGGVGVWSVMAAKVADVPVVLAGESPPAKASSSSVSSEPFSDPLVSSSEKQRARPPATAQANHSDDPILRGGVYWLVRQPAVQEDIKATTEQLRALAMLDKAAQQRLQDHRAARDFVRGSIELAQAQEEAVADILTAEQLRRVRQIHLQSQGLGALDDPQIAGKLKLTEQQRQRIAGRQKEIVQQLLVNLNEKNLREARDKQQALLTQIIADDFSDEQRALWRGLAGPPFTGTLNLDVNFNGIGIANTNSRLP